MRKYFLIGLFGFFGAILRYLIEQIEWESYHEYIPLNTLFITIVGCFLLGVFITIVLEISDFNPNIRIGIATGFLGAFTTFSTYCKETGHLVLDGYYFSAISYLIDSLTLGFVAIFFGVALAKKLIANRMKGIDGN